MAAAKKSRARVTETVRRVVQFKDTGSIMFDAERDGNGDVTIDVDCGDSYTFKFEDLKKVVAALERKP